MRKTLFTTGAAVLALTAFPATAQVAGNSGGQVGGQIGGQVTTPPLGSTIDRTRDLTRETVRDTGRITRDTAQDAQDTLGHTPDVDAEISADAQADAGVDASSASADLDVEAGAMVHASDGAMLGHVVNITRDAAGRAQSLAVRTADGAVRTVPAAGASVEGRAVVTTMTEAEFEALPQ
jgi:hypothetical protein